LKIGFVKSSSGKPTIQRLKDCGCGEIFSKNTRISDFVRKGDTLIVTELSELELSLNNLIDLLKKFNEEGINFISLNESIDTTGYEQLPELIPKIKELYISDESS